MSDTRATDGRPESVAASSTGINLLPILGVVFSAFLVIGMAIPVLPLHVHEGLGFSTFVVGLVAGSQFTASLLTRLWAGRYTDRRGAKRAVVTGLLMAAASGLLYLLSLGFLSMPEVSVAILLLGRAVLGGAESMLITGAQTWGLMLGGVQNAGRVIAWVGVALWAAYGLGAPLGTALYAASSFTSIASATLFLPLLALLLVVPLRANHAHAEGRAALGDVLRAVWLPGLGAALSSLGFGTITTFAPLVFAERGWGSAWLALTTLSAAFILARLILGHLPDRMGGARVALVFLLVESLGQGVIWLALSPALSILGAAVTGFGYSLVYPGFGREAVLRAPAQSRGQAMGVYTAFLDLALGLGNPGLGLIAGRAGLSTVFLVSAVVVLCGVVVAGQLVRARLRT